MLVTRKSRLHIRAQNIIFVALVLGALGLIGYLSTRYVWEADWTAGNRNSLSVASRGLLATLTEPIHITTFARDNETLRAPIRELVSRYQRVTDNLTLTFVNPDLEPTRVREQGITVDGELVIEYAGRRENVRELSETAISNALQRLARGGERWAVFITGHGERAPEGQANFDLGVFGKTLRNKGFNVQTLYLAEQGALPRNTAFVVIAGPQADYLPAEIKLLQDYLASGGNLLWLREPGAGEHGLHVLAQELGIRFLPGMLVDSTAQLFGISDPTMILVANYPPTPVTQDFAYATVFPQATAIMTPGATTDTTTTDTDGKQEDKSGWQTEPFLRTLPRAWQETGKLSGAVRFDADTGDKAGPLTLGLLLTRTAPDSTSAEKAASKSSAGEQRVVVIGDGDFLANAYIGNSGNLDLGLNIFNWLGHDDSYINIPARTAPDTQLHLSDTALAMLVILFLAILPLGLLAAGALIWWRRRRL